MKMFDFLLEIRSAVERGDIVFYVEGKYIYMRTKNGEVTIVNLPQVNAKEA